MRKIRLEPEKLMVDSFTLSDPSLDLRGTVKALITSPRCVPSYSDDLCCTMHCTFNCSDFDCA